MEDRTETRGKERRRLVLGLGNPGEKYSETRHNLGFAVAGSIAARRHCKLGQLVCNSVVGESGDLIVALPQTYMNRSGYAARCLAEKYAIDPRDILVIYDDIDLPLGTIRLRAGGGPSGHRGMESIIESLRTEGVPRIRVGIAGSGERPQGDDLVDYVLARFDESEVKQVEQITESAADLAEKWLNSDETESETVQLAGE